MLHENAKQRLWRMVPRDYTIEWLDPLRNEVVADTISLDPATQIRWARQGSAPRDPTVYLNIQPQGTPRGDFGHMFEDGIYRDEHPDPTVAYTEYTAAPQRARLIVTVSTTKGTKEIPKRVVADSIAIDCWHAFRFESDHLSDQGTTPEGVELENAIPLGVVPAGGGMEDTSRMIDEQATERRQFEFRLDYVYFDAKEVPATDSIIWRFGVDKNYDGEVEEWGDWHQTPGGDSDSQIDDVDAYMAAKDS